MARVPHCGATTRSAALTLYSDTQQPPSLCQNEASRLFLSASQQPHGPAPPSAPHPPFPSASICPVCSGAMYLMKTEDGCYTLKKVDAKGLPTSSAHPARFSPDDKFSRHRVTLKKRFGILMTQSPAPKC